MEELTRKEEMEFNSRLQQKKNSLRADLATKGVLVKKGSNDFDHYKYFSEAQYKELFTELMPKHRLEMNFSVIEVTTFEMSGKNSNGRLARLAIMLQDIDTGYYETTEVYGEGADKGDKALYKAYTGALKYYLANTFMVATGDDAEKDSPTEKMNNRTSKRDYVPQMNDDPLISQEQVMRLRAHADEVGISAEQICGYFSVESLPELSQTQWTKATKMLNDEADRQKSRRRNNG